ncbi:hypothetical protein [Flavobacterium selenitireducens]|uniref:hypothetical protein n=1 Tax=Flavobacterium selenitireducens TaxID=2722704 RepID=UPI00168A7587|nr:hypothetical protein [Flavobacterium selenitireducens]MBD3583691.1 hypothetical protein [Flavobacterium selenitireducens]
MNFLHLTETDVLLAIITTSGVLAGLFAYLMLPSVKRGRQNCIKSMLFGIIFSLVSYMLVHALFDHIMRGVPVELRGLFSWCVSFLPALLLSITYGLVVRRQGKVEF